MLQSGMKPLRWLLSYIVTNHLVNQAKTRIVNRLTSTYSSLGSLRSTSFGDTNLIRGAARLTSYFYFSSKNVNIYKYQKISVDIRKNIWTVYISKLTKYFVCRLWSSG